ncbi:hypothetical protein C5167_004170 [Papaver somniferum]|nr:hypothetical protein C5167_004170 [Papaver somniferum]
MSKRPMLTDGTRGESRKTLLIGRLHLMTLSSPNGQPSKGTEEGYVQRNYLLPSFAWEEKFDVEEANVDCWRWLLEPGERKGL